MAISGRAHIFCYGLRRIFDCSLEVAASVSLRVVGNIHIDYKCCRRLSFVEYYCRGYYIIVTFNQRTLFEISPPLHLTLTPLPVASIRRVNFAAEFSTTQLPHTKYNILYKYVVYISNFSNLPASKFSVSFSLFFVAADLLIVFPPRPSLISRCSCLLARSCGAGLAWGHRQ